MTFIPAILLLSAGLAVLIFGAEYLVRGASRIAARFGLPPLIIGLTIVAFGTSAPELAVSIRSAYAGQPEIAVGNVVGSNIFNILFILGLSAAVRPITVKRQLIRFDTPLMIIVSLVVLGISTDGIISRLNGALLFGGIVLYVLFLLSVSRRRKHASGHHDAAAHSEHAQAKPQSQVWADAALVIAGTIMLLLGAKWSLSAAIDLAHSFGVSELVIGLTIVAFGTSLPEIATSVVASLNNEGDISVGNIVGSNIFNLLSVLGLTALVAPAGIAVSPHAVYIDMPVMALCAIMCLPIFFTWHVISRWEGWLLLSCYAVYVVFLFLDAAQSAILPHFNNILMYGVLPGVMLILFATTVWELIERRRSPAAVGRH